MTSTSYQQQTRGLIDGLKAVCSQNGLGNDGNEYRIIVQTFLYRLLCDKFAHEMKAHNPGLAASSDWIAARRAVPVAPDERTRRFHDSSRSLERKRQNGLRGERELTRLRDWLLPLRMNGQVRVA